MTKSGQIDRRICEMTAELTKQKRLLDEMWADVVNTPQYDAWCEERGIFDVNYNQLQLLISQREILENATRVKQ